jgi:hypothetical protein
MVFKEWFNLAQLKWSLVTINIFLIIMNTPLIIRSQTLSYRSYRLKLGVWQEWKMFYFKKVKKAKEGKKKGSESGCTIWQSL